MYMVEIYEGDIWQVNKLGDIWEGIYRVEMEYVKADIWGIYGGVNMGENIFGRVWEEGHVGINV